MKSKAQKNTVARKNAEALKAKKKAIRDTQAKGTVANKPGVKGKSAVPQARKRGK